MIVWLASYPRSGNTLFRILLNRLHGIETYSIYNDAIFEERPEVAAVVGHRHADCSLEEMAASPELFVVKTHDLPAGDAFPAIYLVRDGRDALVSYAHFALAFERPTTSPPEGDAFEDMLRNLVVSTDSFGGWGPNVMAWAIQRQAPTTVVKYEELVADPPGVLARTLAVIPTSIDSRAPADKVPSFDTLREQLPQFFRRGRAGAWQDEMPPDIQQLFWKHHSHAMLALGYRED